MSTTAEGQQDSFDRLTEKHCERIPVITPNGVKYRFTQRYTELESGES